MAVVLLMGADRGRTEDLRALLREDGHDVTLCRQPRIWRAAERDSHPEVVVAAVEQPESLLDGACPRSRGFAAPLLFVQSEPHTQRVLHLDNRLVDRIGIPFQRDELLGRVDALVRVRRVIRRDPSVSAAPGAAARRGDPAHGPRSMRGMARRVAAALGARLPRATKPLAPYLAVAARVAEWAERRDSFQPGHAERVAGHCGMIAEGLGLADRETAALLRAATLHDIGKVAVPVEVLNQREPLEESQILMIRTHPRRGAALLRALDRDEEVADAIHYHHERPDGAGYYGMEGTRIPVAARALAVAEVFDAMTSTSLRTPLTPDDALQRLERLRGDTLDADCVDALVDRLGPRSRYASASSSSRSAVGRVTGSRQV